MDDRDLIFRSPHVFIVGLCSVLLNADHILRAGARLFTMMLLTFSIRNNDRDTVISKR